MIEQYKNIHNRPHEVDQKIGAFLFNLYKLLFKSSIPLNVKQRTFETAANCKDSWRVVSISTSAIQHIKKEGVAKGLQRGHILPRIERARHMFERENPMMKDDLLRYFFEHDTVALVTKKENSKTGTIHWSQLHQVPEGLFIKGSYSIYARKNVEISWVNDLNL